jgi:nucleotide-binding universal stress UspA family protein
MSYKTLLVHVDSGTRAGIRVDIACRLARLCDAHLIGLHAMTVVHLPRYAALEGGTQIREHQDRLAREAATRAEETFRKGVAAAGVEKFEWRASRGDAAQVVPVHGRYADLLILGQPSETDASGVEPVFAERVLLEAGRPVLLVPYAGDFPSVGTKVLVAWNAGREATRALTDAIPILRAAVEVHVVSIGRKDAPQTELPAADIGVYLARHDINVTVAEQTASDVGVGNQLLSRAADLDADLIVMGAYGHSRMAELILGGATRTVLKSMTVPVLMSH